MIQLNNLCIEFLSKDLSIYSIIISILSFLISFYINIISPKKKKIDAYVVFDDFNYKPLVIVKNSGNKPLVISSLKLYAQKNRFSKQEFLGERRNFWNINKRKNPLSPQHTIIYSPKYGNHNDIFGFWGHFCEVNDENRNYNLYVVITEIEGKKFKKKLPYTLGELADIIQPAINLN